MSENNNNTKEFAVNKLFEEFEFVIPIYQRNYAWGETEIIQLLDDINDTEKTYYIGSLIVDHKKRNVYEVIDGQQRLTTLFLLMMALKSDSLNRDSLRFEARSKSNNTLRELQPGFQGGEDYSDGIIAGFRIIENYFKKVSKDSFVKKLENIHLIITQVPTDTDLNHYFEIMNTRGEQLELHEIEKERLLKRLEEEHVDEKTRDICAAIWDACSNMNRYVQMNFDTNLRKQIFGEDWESIKTYSEIMNLLKTDGSADQKSSGKSKLIDIIRSTNETGDETNNEEIDEGKIRFESIISFPAFLLQVNAAMKENDIEDDKLLDDKKLLEDLEWHHKNKESVFIYIYNLLKYRLLFDKYIIKREYAKNDSTEGNWSLKKLKKYKDKKRNNSEKAEYVITHGYDEADSSDLNDNVKMLQSCLRITYTSPKTMHWIHKLLKSLNENQEMNQVDFLEKYLAAKVNESRIEERNGIDFERVVFTYLDYVLWRDNTDKFKDFQFQFRTSIEHFFPQHPLDGEPWDSTKPLNDFGNLALLTVSANSKFSNLPPIAKIEKKEINQSPKLIIMKEITEKNKRWTENEVRSHGEEMLNLLKTELRHRLN